MEPTVAGVTSVAVNELHPSVDAEVHVDGDADQIPILTITTIAGHWLIYPSGTRPTPADLSFAEALAIGAANYRDQLRRHS